MANYQSKFTGQEIDNILTKAQSLELGATVKLVVLQSTDNLPEPSKNILGNFYFKPIDNNKYQEYICINKGTELMPEYIWEVFGTIDSESLLNYYTKSEIDKRLVGYNTEDDGIIFNDYENNQAIAKNSTVFGTQNQAGGKAYTVLAVHPDTAQYTLDSLEGIEVNDPFSVCIYTLNGEGKASYPRYDFRGEITAIDIDNKKITVTNFMVSPYGYDFVPLTEEQYIIDGVDTGWNTISIPTKLNYGTRKLGAGILVAGTSNIAFGQNSITMGNKNKTIGNNSMAVGSKNITGYAAFASGEFNEARGTDSTAMGYENSVSGKHAFASGAYNTVSVDDAFAAGKENTISGVRSVAFGHNNQITGMDSFAIGENNIASVSNSFAFGQRTKASYTNTFAFGEDCEAKTRNGSAFGYHTKTRDNDNTPQFVIGKYNVGDSNTLFEIGNGTENNLKNAFVVTKNGDAIVENRLIATSIEANTGTFINFSIGGKSVLTTDMAIGQHTTSHGTIIYDSAGNSSCQATGIGAFAAGNNSQANYRSATAFGEGTNAQYLGTFAAGIYSTAVGYSSVALGLGTTTTSGSSYVVGGQTAVGRYNKSSTDSVFIVGNGTNENNEWTRSTAFEVKNDGSAHLQTQGIDDNSVVIKKYVDQQIQALQEQINSLQ